MKHTVLNLPSLLLPLLMLVGLTACDHKELCYIHPHSTRVTVVYDWTDAPEASPAGMCAYFYSLDYPGRNYRFDFPGAKGGDIEISMGRYLVLTYNNDTEAVRFTGTGEFDSHLATTRVGDILEPMYGNGVVSSLSGREGESVMITPDDLYGCTVTELEITEHGVRYIHSSNPETGRDVTTNENGDQIITLYPHDMLCHYTYEVRNVKQAKHIVRISGAISGMSGSMHLAAERLHAEPVTLPLPAQANAADKNVTGEFLTFGHHEDNPAPHRMSFYVVMDDGSKYSFTTGDNLDVTSQVHSAPNRRRVHLIIDHLDLPTPIENGNGFNPSVEDWGVVEEDLEI